MNSRPTNCFSCNNLLKRFTLESNSSNILNSIISTTRLSCPSCDDIDFIYDGNNQLPDRVVIHGKSEPYNIIISFIKDKTYYTCFDKCDFTNYEEYALSKALPLDYLLSHSKEEILNKVKFLLTFS